MKELFFSLISATRGNGPSSTRLVYLVNGLAAVFCALVMTIGGIIVYCAAGKADAVYWTTVAALWTATLGFGSKTKNEQQKATTEIALGPRHDALATAVSGD
jgi:hypothetical protein